MHEKKVFTYASLKITIENEFAHLNVLYALSVKSLLIFDDELIEKCFHL